MMQWLFWLSAAFLLYVYVGYPLLLIVWARVTRRRTHCARMAAVPPPPVSVVVVVRHEAQRVPDRIENLVSLDYPADLQIILVCDGSPDDGCAVPERYRSRVEVIMQPPRGKAAALNAGVARARHDIIVFADARQTFARDALRALVARFADARVGAVSGELLLDVETPADSRPDERSPIADGVGMYWRYEKTLRRLESAVASTIGATGAIYAMRRSLWQPLPENTILDDVLAPMRAVLAGSVVVFEERARAFDRVPSDVTGELRRKIRTLAGNVQILWLEPRLLVPFVNPVWLQYVSHKVGRLLAPYSLITLFISSLALVGKEPIYTAAFVLQCGFYGLSGYGAWLANRARRRSEPCLASA
jgi:cellulose synthase/poly-beta-1,6-N-acetylglucosamine synthase-like glycosyltransferase